MTRGQNEAVMNWLYVGFVLGVSAVGLGFIAWSTAKLGFQDLAPGSNSIAITLIDLACIGLFAALIWKTYRDTHTRISDEGVRQPGLRSSKFIRWDDIKEVRFVHFGIHLLGAAGLIVVTPYAYRNPEQLIERMRAYLRQAGHNI